MTENIRGALVYELICGIQACTVLVKQPPGLWLEPNPFQIKDDAKCVCFFSLLKGGGGGRGLRERRNNFVFFGII